MNGGSRPAIPGCSPRGQRRYRTRGVGPAYLGEPSHRAVDELLPGNSRDVRHGHVRDDHPAGPVRSGVARQRRSDGHRRICLRLDVDELADGPAAGHALECRVVNGFRGIRRRCLRRGHRRDRGPATWALPCGPHPGYRRRSARGRQSIPRTSRWRERPDASGSVSGGRLCERRHIRRNRRRRWRGAA